MIQHVSPTEINPELWDRYSAQDKPYPFYSYAWHRLWDSVFGQQNSWILTFDNSILAPFYRTGQIVALTGGPEIADYLDIIGDDGKKEKAWEEIILYCKNEGVTTLVLDNVPEFSPTVSFFQSQTSLFSSSRIEKQDTTPMMSLPGNWETYLSGLSRHSRHELRRKLKNFENQYPHMKMYTSENPQMDMEALLRLMKLDEMKNMFLTDKMQTFFRKLPDSFPGGVRLELLSVDQMIASATFAFTSVDTVYLYNSGFDETQFSGAGFYLKATNIKRAIEDGFTTYNFLQGNERYKYELGGADQFVYRIEVKI
jgi:CelD/BcsL family acetyltransferase involved in cellulose biosynthesis